MTTTPDPSFAGRTYPAGPVHTVSAAKIAAFARATGARSPLPTDPQAPHPAGPAGLPAPPPLPRPPPPAPEAPYIQAPASGIHFSRVVHGGEAFTPHRPVGAGDRLVPTLTVESVRAA